MIFIIMKKASNTGNNILNTYHKVHLLWKESSNIGNCDQKEQISYTCILISLKCIIVFYTIFN